MKNGSCFISLLVTVLFVSSFILNLHAASLPDNVKLTITVNSKTKTLHLHKADIRTKDYAVQLWSKSGGFTTVNPLPEVRTFRGTIEENGNAIVIANINENNKLLAACIDMEWGHGVRWYANVDVANQLKTPVSANPMPAQPSASPKSGSSNTPNIGPKVPTGISAQTSIPYGEIIEAEMGLDIFRQAYEGKGKSVLNCIAEYEYMTMIHDYMMTRDVFIHIAICQMVIRTTDYDDATETKKLWKAAPLNTVPWDMVWGSSGGYAAGPQFSYGAMYHENGHNWGAKHLVYMCDIMGGNKTNIGPITVDKIFKNRKGRIDAGALSLAKTINYPIHPHTHVDAFRIPKDNGYSIDPLANDWDANGDSISIVSYTQTTKTGGTVKLGADGKLQYTPKKGYIGKDIIVYTIQDHSPMALRNRDVIHIEIVNNALMVHYAFEQDTGTIVADSSGIGLPGDLNGANFSTHSVPSPMGRGIRSSGKQDDNAIENGNWSGILAGVGNVFPVELNPNRQASPCEKEYNHHSAFYDPMDGDYTFASWFAFDSYKSTDFHSWGHYIAAKFWHMETRVGWDLRAINGSLTLHWTIFNGEKGYQALNYNYNFQQGVWYHAAAIFDQTKNEARIYLNGKLVATKENAFTSNRYIFNGRAPLMIAPFVSEKGYIDDVRIYSKALTDKEVLGLYEMAGIGKPHFFNNSSADSIFIEKYYTLNINKLLWDGGDSNLKYEVLNIPTWMKVASTGKVIGYPTIKDTGSFAMEIKVTDNNGKVITHSLSIMVHNHGLLEEFWHGIKGNNISALTADPTFPNRPDKRVILSTIDAKRDVGNNYGSKISGFISPDVSGDYTFWIAADDNGELWLSTDENPANKKKIAYTSGNTNYKQFNKTATQKSVEISFLKGKMYYVEALLKEGVGADHLTVAWKGPGIDQQVIPQANLLLFEPKFLVNPKVIHHWAFDETSGSTIIDSVGTMNGTASGSPVLTTLGATSKTGTAITFDGVDDKISLNGGQRNAPWTISMRVKHRKTTGTSTFMKAGKYLIRFRQYATDGKVGITETGKKDYAFNYYLPKDKWAELMFACDGKNTTLWADGKRVGFIVANIKLPLDNLGSASVKADVDEVIVYDQAFTEDYILLNKLKNDTATTATIGFKAKKSIYDKYIHLLNNPYEKGSGNLPILRIGSTKNSIVDLNIRIFDAVGNILFSEMYPIYGANNREIPISFINNRLGSGAYLMVIYIKDIQGRVDVVRRIIGVKE